MKKCLYLTIILAVLMGFGIVRADGIDDQVTLKETQLQSLQWEFRYLQERAVTIQGQAQKLQMEIDALKKQKEEAKKKESGSEVVK